MIRVSVSTRAILALALAASLTIPAYGEAPPPGQADDGLTRETFTDSTPAPAPTRSAPRAQTKHRRLDPKHVRSVHHARRHRRATKKRSHTAAVVAPAPRRRNPVVGFVYWWNGWVLKTFHTKVGTVMLGTVGAKS